MNEVWANLGSFSPYAGPPLTCNWWRKSRKPPGQRRAQRWPARFGRGCFQHKQTHRIWCSSRNGLIQEPPLSSSRGRRSQIRSWTARRPATNRIMNRITEIGNPYNADNTHDDGSFLDVHVLIVLNQRSMIPRLMKRLRWSRQLRPENKIS